MNQRQRMRRADLVVSVGADEQEVVDLRINDEILEQFQRGHIQPLQVIQEEREGMLGTGKNAEKSPEHPLEPVIRILARKVGHGRLLADH